MLSHSFYRGSVQSRHPLLLFILPGPAGFSPTTLTKIWFRCTGLRPIIESLKNVPPITHAINETEVYVERIRGMWISAADRGSVNLTTPIAGKKQPLAEALAQAECEKSMLERMSKYFGCWASLKSIWSRGRAAALEDVRQNREQVLEIRRKWLDWLYQKQESY